MVKASKGLRSGTRRKLRKRLREKFKVEPFLREFRPGERVVIEIEPSSQKGMPHPRFKGRIGTVKARRGNSYLVGIKVGKKEKVLTARPEHLKPAG